MSISRRTFLVVGVAGVAAACTPAAPAAPTAAPTSAPAPVTPPTAQPTLAPTVAPTATPAASLKIGVLVPYTESAVGVDIGLDQKRAADLYLKQHGGKLGGRAVSVVYSSESVELGINKVKIKTLTDTEKVGLLLGGASDETAGALRDAAIAAKMVYVDTNATANALTRAKSAYVFRTSASAWQLSEPLGEWTAQQASRDFFVSHVDDTFGAESADAFVQGLAKNQGTVVDRVAFPSGGDWVQAIGGTIKGQSTKNVYAAFHTDDAEGFLGEWNKQGLADAGYKLFGPGPLADTEIIHQAQAAVEGAVTAHFWSTELDNAENRTLLDQFAQAYTDEDTGQPIVLSGYAVAMWDAMTALDLALKQTGGSTSDVQALIAALEGVSFKSPRGAFAFDKSTHNPVHDIFIRQVNQSNGKLVNAIVERIPAVADPGA